MNTVAILDINGNVPMVSGHEIKEQYTPDVKISPQDHAMIHEHRYIHQISDL